MTTYDISKAYNKYADDVLSGKIVACAYVKKACERYKSWFNKDDRYFDYADVDRRIRLVAKMRHFRGKSNKKPFILLPYQQFIFANIFGFKWCETKFRITQNVLIFMGRKNGKSSLASAICLTQILLDKNNAQEIDFIASTGAQARICFDMTKNYAESIDPNGLIFKRFRDSIKMPLTKSEIDVRNSDSMTLDGLNSSTFIADEGHSYKNADLWHVLKSSQGFQEQPLAILISTAGYLLDGYFLYDYITNCKAILDGTKEDDSQFSLLYSLDDGDDWRDETTWIKANPSLGVTVTYDYLRNECTQAKNQPSLEHGFRTKLMNQFCQSSETWITSNIIKDTMQTVDLEDFKSEEAYCGVDLSAVSDMTATTIMFPPNKDRKKWPDKYVFKTFIYLPETTLESSVNKSLYQKWNRHNEIIVTDGNVVDYAYILKDQLELANKHTVLCMAYDQWNATQWAIQATQEGLPLVPYSQSLGNFNKPTKFLEILIKSGKCIIDESSCVLWCFNNVVIKEDYNGNMKPNKNTKEQKIDPIISICEALGVYLSECGTDVELV